VNVVNSVQMLLIVLVNYQENKTVRSFYGRIEFVCKAISVVWRFCAQVLSWSICDFVVFAKHRQEISTHRQHGKW
jgi:hypothetical protein